MAIYIYRGFDLKEKREHFYSYNSEMRKEERHHNLDDVIDFVRTLSEYPLVMGRIPNLSHLHISPPQNPRLPEIDTGKRIIRTSLFPEHVRKLERGIVSILEKEPE